MPILSLEIPKETSPSGAPAARKDLRRKARARVSREMLIRAADFNDGSFEEVCSTVNFSRDGFYFLTTHNRYSVGMRLRISPATQPGNEGAWENFAKVVRVHRQGAGFGVGVVLSNDSASAGQTAPAASTKDRRSAARAHFVATTEIIDVQTGEHCRMRTADLSTRGCYIDTLNPLPVAATVRLQIQKENEAAEFRAKVVSSHIGSGMGLVFEGMTSEQRAMLGKWLRGQSTAPTADFGILPRQREVVESNAQIDEDPRFLRLVNLLHRKGMLNESEVRALLRAL
jgi:hypothetical protein